MYLTHPLRVTLCQVIIDCNDVNAFSRQRIQVSRQCGYQRLTFTGLHLSNTALMKDDTADQLHLIVFHIKYTLRGFTHRSVSFRKQ